MAFKRLHILLPAVGGLICIYAGMHVTDVAHSSTMNSHRLHFGSKCMQMIMLELLKLSASITLVRQVHGMFPFSRG